MQQIIYFILHLTLAPSVLLKEPIPFCERHASPAFFPPRQKRTVEAMVQVSRYAAVPYLPPYTSSLTH
jgi:hypothetical protein